MYMRKDAAYMAADALTAANNAATYNPKATKLNETIPLQSELSSINLKLLYIFNNDGDSNPYGIFQEKYLNIIDEIEDIILSDKNNYSNYCKRIYFTNETICSRQRSITQLFDKRYFIGATKNDYTVYPSARNTAFYLLPSLMLNPLRTISNKNYSDANIREIVTYWARYGAGTLESNETYGKGIYNGQEMESIFYYKDPLSKEPNSLINIFRALSDTNFGSTPYNVKGNAVISVFSFGLPLNGYESSTDNIDEQIDVISKWCYDTFDNIFEELSKEYSDDIIFRWDCGNMDTYALRALLWDDILFMLGTFISVYLFMTYMVGSFWLSSWGMIMIFLNFIPSILLYRYISQQSYFGTLNMLGMFIILAIGADDIFVINDTFSQIRLEYGNKATRAQRLTATIKHAGGVMATTSISTIFSFLGNTSSQFPAGMYVVIY